MRPDLDYRDQDWIVWISMTRPWLKMSESQWWDQDQDSMKRLRLKMSESKWQDWTKYADTKTPSRPLLISAPHYVHHQRGLGCFGYCLQKVRLAIPRHDLSETVISFIGHTILGSTCNKVLSAQLFLAYFFGLKLLGNPYKPVLNTIRIEEGWG